MSIFMGGKRASMALILPTTALLVALVSLSFPLLADALKPHPPYVMKFYYHTPLPQNKLMHMPPTPTPKKPVYVPAPTPHRKSAPMPKKPAYVPSTLPKKPVKPMNPFKIPRFNLPGRPKFHPIRKSPPPHPKKPTPQKKPVKPIIMPPFKVPKFPKFPPRRLSPPLPPKKKFPAAPKKKFPPTRY